MRPVHALLSVPISLLLVATVVQSADLAVAWESVDGFHNPESVLFDSERNLLYVSNVNGHPMELDSNGYISRLNTDGTAEEIEWVTGLHAPKGMAMFGDKLYVSDINALVEIDIESGQMMARHEAEGAKFMNDVAVDENGNVYASDMVTNTIHRLTDGTLSVWVQDDALDNPNGLLVEGNHLVVGAWGTMNPDFSTDTPGHLKRVSLADGSIEILGDGSPAGNLDGVESDGDSNYYVTDWVAGALLLIEPSGASTSLLDLEQGSADLEVLLNEGMLIIPMMNNDKLVAYQLPE